VEILLARGANPAIINKKGKTALNLCPAARTDIRETLKAAEESYEANN
jgi:hypothetical protein